MGFLVDEEMGGGCFGASRQNNPTATTHHGNPQRPLTIIQADCQFSCAQARHIAKYKMALG